MNSLRLIGALLLSFLISEIALAQGTRLLRHPTVSRDSVAFEYAGDLWIVGRAGGQARRLTATPGAEIDPYFSPDGSQIAFTSTVAGNTDVYVVPAAGGDPKRLTYHPGVDRARGWTTDGKRVIFASGRTSAPQQAYFRLWTIGLDGGLPNAMPMRARSMEPTRRMAGKSPTKRSLRRSSPPGTKPACGVITAEGVLTRSGS